MACESVKLTAESRQRQITAIEKLDKALALGTVTIAIGAQGGIAFKGWNGADDGIMDVCAYRRLQAANSAGLRKALARAEVMSGRKVNERAISAGVHSHDGGSTWSRH